MKVRAIINFNDLEENKHRIANESEWECTEKRANYLLEHKAVEIVDKIKELEKELSGLDSIHVLTSKPKKNHSKKAKNYGKAN